MQANLGKGAYGKVDYQFYPYCGLFAAVKRFKNFQHDNNLNTQ
jgi:hypothetical protein